MGGRAKVIKRTTGILLLLAVAFAVWFYGPLVYGLWRHGVFERPSAAHEYEGTSIDNLKAIRTALLGYEESEGQFPVATGWMDAISNRLRTDDLKKGEEAKKLIYPGYAGQPGKYGYAFNDAVSGKYHGDVKDPKTLLVFESSATDKNAHGSPDKLRREGGVGITVGGDIVH